MGEGGQAATAAGRDALERGRESGEGGESDGINKEWQLMMEKAKLLKRNGVLQCCSVLQCAAVCCSVLQCVLNCVLQCVEACFIHTGWSLI